MSASVIGRLRLRAGTKHAESSLNLDLSVGQRSVRYEGLKANICVVVQCDTNIERRGVDGNARLLQRFLGQLILAILALWQIQTRP